MTNIRKTTILQDILAAIHGHTPNMQLNIAHDMAIDFFESYAPHLLNSDDELADWETVNSEFSASTTDEVRKIVELVWSIFTLSSQKHRVHIDFSEGIFASLIHDLCNSMDENSEPN